MGIGWFTKKHDSVTLTPRPPSMWSQDGCFCLRHWPPRISSKGRMRHFSSAMTFITEGHLFPQSSPPAHLPCIGQGHTHKHTLNKSPARAVVLPWLSWNNQHPSPWSWERGHVSRSNWGSISKKEGRRGCWVGSQQPSTDRIGNACCRSGFIYIFPPQMFLLSFKCHDEHSGIREELDTAPFFSGFSVQEFWSDM